MPPPLPPSGQPGQYRPSDALRGDPPSTPRPPARPGDPPSALRRAMPTLPEPASRRESALIWIQTVLLGLICAGILVMYQKIASPKTLPNLIAPRFANLFGPSLLVGLMQLIRGKAWPWPAVGMIILVL